jgi:hypothetical protein
VRLLDIIAQILLQAVAYRNHIYNPPAPRVLQKILVIFEGKRNNKNGHIRCFKGGEYGCSTECAYAGGAAEIVHQPCNRHPRQHFKPSGPIQFVRKSLGS